MMSAMKQKRTGRPQVDAAQRLTQRHVVNLSQGVDQAVRRYCEVNGVARHTDGMRQLIVKALRAEGLL